MLGCGQDIRYRPHLLIPTNYTCIFSRVAWSARRRNSCSGVPLDSNIAVEMAPDNGTRDASAPGARPAMRSSSPCRTPPPATSVLPFTRCRFPVSMCRSLEDYCGERSPLALRMTASFIAAMIWRGCCGGPGMQHIGRRCICTPGASRCEGQPWAIQPILCPQSTSETTSQTRMPILSPAISCYIVWLQPLLRAFDVLLYLKCCLMVIDEFRTHFLKPMSSRMRARESNAPCTYASWHLCRWDKRSRAAAQLRNCCFRQGLHDDLHRQ